VSATTFIEVAYGLFGGVFGLFWAIARYAPSIRGFEVKISIVPLSMSIRCTFKGKKSKKK
jgi:hypothetical protein